jgi:small Trp-rich protein
MRCQYNPEGFAMWFLGLGLLALALKYFEIGMVATWSWWIVLSPFAMAVAWWAWADSSGYTKRKIVERENRRKQERIDRQKNNMGIKTTNGQRPRR